MKNSRRPSASKGGKRRGTPAGREILSALTELAEVLESGRPEHEVYTIRTVELPDDPRPYSAAAVRTTRNRVRASQAVFARMLGVSVMLVQAWERGARTPAPWARRLLDEVNRDLSHWRGMLRPTG